MTTEELGNRYGLELSVASGLEHALCAGAICQFHYLRTFPDPRGMPVVYSVRLRGRWVGTVCFGRPESNRCYKGGLTYGSIGDVAAGKARRDRWEVLNLSRVWLSPEVQHRGELCHPDFVPGFLDRKGVFRTTFASCVVRAAIHAIRVDYLLIYPPCFLEEPYQIRSVLSYCDTRVHRGVLYRAAGFSLSRTNRAGIETWFTDDVPTLSETEDARVRHASKHNDRSQKKRAARGQLGTQGIFEHLFQ